MASRNYTKLFIFTLVAFQYVNCEHKKTTLGKLMDKWKEYTSTLDLQNNSLNRLSPTVKATKKIDDNLQDLFQQVLDKLKPIIEFKDPSFIDHIDFNKDSPLVRLKGAMNSIKLSGMGQYSVDILNVTQNLDFQIGFGFANLMVEGDYDIDFNVLTLLPFYGAGEFGILLTGFNISLAVNFQEGPDSLQGNHLKLDFKLDQIQLEMGGFAGGGKVASFINNVLSGVGADIIMEYKDVILDLINPILESEMNRMLARDKITIEFVVNAIKEFLKRT